MHRDTRRAGVGPSALARAAIDAGRTDPHRLTGHRRIKMYVLRFAPRDESELDVIAGPVAQTHYYVTGWAMSRAA